MYARLALFLFVCCTSLATLADFQPKAEKVVAEVYALVGPLSQRSAENDGLNANFGFVVTPQGVILIDSGASRLGAEKIDSAIRAVTAQPVRWVINTGAQDHRWLGNDYFAAQGAQIIALARTAATQAQFADQHLAGLSRFLGERVNGTRPLPATETLAGDTVTLQLGGVSVNLAYTDAHFPGDARVWLPAQGVAFSGDLVFVDRMLGVLPWSNVNNSQRAFQALAALQPTYIVPGHGRVCDLAQAQRETGDYYDFLVNRIGAAAVEMESMSEVLARHADLPAFKHLENYDGLHRANMNRAFVEFEGR